MMNILGLTNKKKLMYTITAGNFLKANVPIEKKMA